MSLNCSSFVVTICTTCRNSTFLFHVILTTRDQWVPVTMAWHVLRLRMEERPPVWRVAANILNKQSRTADERWYSSLRVGRGANNCYLVAKRSHCKPVTWTDVLVRPKQRKRDMRCDGWTFSKWDVGVLTGLSWRRIGTVGEHL